MVSLGRSDAILASDIIRLYLQRTATMRSVRGDNLTEYDEEVRNLLEFIEVQLNSIAVEEGGQQMVAQFLGKNFTFSIIKKQKEVVMATVESKWEEIKELVASLETDVVKNASGNAAAGTRARKGLRTLKRNASDLVKLTLGKEVD